MSSELKEPILARAIRAHVLHMTHRANASHVGSCLSIADLLAVLYSDVLRVDPARPGWPDRDRFILSKGHGCAALYAVLAAEQGFFPEEWLDTYCQDGAHLAGHITHRNMPGVEVSTGSLGQNLSETLGLRFAWLRLFSAYGAMDDRSWLIPHVILTLLRGERPSLILDEQRCDYLYVEDAVEAIWRAAITPGAQGIFNLGSGEAYTIRSIAERIRDLIDPSLPLGFGEVPYRPDQIMHLQADITKLKKATSWKPRTSIDDGLRQTVEWYRERKERGLWLKTR